MSAEAELHAAICNAVILLNNGEETAPEVSAILRTALANYNPAPPVVDARELQQPQPVSADEINALPDKIRRYIHDLETEADPAGTIRQNILVREENKMLRKHIATEHSAYAELAAERDALITGRERWLRRAGDYLIRAYDAESQLVELRGKCEALSTDISEAVEDVARSGGYINSDEAKGWSAELRTLAAADGGCHAG